MAQQRVWLVFGCVCLTSNPFNDATRCGGKIRFASDRYVSRCIPVYLYSLHIQTRPVNGYVGSKPGSWNDLRNFLKSYPRF